MTRPMRADIRSIEYYLPTRVENGAALKADMPEWRIEDIELKTGVGTRHIAEAGEAASDMAVAAAEKLFVGGARRDEIDFLILVTQSPDYALPTTACIVQNRLGLKTSCMAFDVNLGCSGFVYALAMGSAFIESGLARQGLVICSETYTKYIDRTDRACRPLFSDGAAAVLIGGSADSRIGPFELGTDGTGFQNLIVRPDAANSVGSGRLFMDGAQVFMFTMNMVPKCVEALLAKAQVDLDQIDLFVFHQASRLVIDSIVRRLKLPEHKVFRNYDRIGNTVSASIPIALKDAVDAGSLSPGNLAMLVGFGVGYSWGACLLRWGGEFMYSDQSLLAGESV